MSSFRWIPWEQPILKSNKDYGEVSASSINQTSPIAYPWKASDGIKSGSGTSWEAAREVCPASWLWRLPVTLRITKMVLYNKYSGYTNVTKDVSVYSDEEQQQKICSGTFSDVPFSTLTFTFDEPVISDTLCVVCKNGHYNPGCFVGLGEIPATNLATKGDSITFSTPTIEGTIYRRNKLDGQNRHPWKAEVNENDTSVPASVISGWFSEVYEPDYEEVV